MAWSNVISSANAVRKNTVAELNNLAIVVPEMRSISALQASNSLAVNVAGIPQPNGDPTLGLNGSSGLTASSIYTYGVGLYDSAHDSAGVIRNTVQITTGASTNASVSINFSAITNEASNTRTDFYRVYRSQAGGSVLNLVGSTSIAAASFIDTVPDATATANDLLLVGNNALIAPTADTFGWVVRHNSRLFFGGPADYYDFDSAFANRAGWTPTNNPDPIPTNNQVQIGRGNSGGPLRSGSPLGDSFVVYQEQGIHLWLYQDDPSGIFGDGSIQRVVENRGTLTFKTVVNVEGMHFVMDRRGWYMYQGGQQVRDITDNIRPLLERVNWDERHKFAGAASDDRIYWSVALDKETECRYLVVLDLDSFVTLGEERWWLYKTNQGVRDLTAVKMGRSASEVSNGIAERKFVALSTDFIPFLVLDIGFADGAHPSVTTSGTIDSSNSITFTDASANFRGNGDGSSRGLYVKFDDSRTPDPFLIVSETSTTFTLGSTSGAAQVGIGFELPPSTAYVIGGIEAFYKTGQFDFGDAGAMKSGHSAQVQFQPRPINFGLQAKFRRDRFEPDIIKRTQDHTGWNATENDDFYQIDMGGNHTSNSRSGFAEIPVGGEDFHYLSVELRSDNVNNPWAVTDLSVLPTVHRVDL